MLAPLNTRTLIWLHSTHVSPRFILPVIQ